MKTLYLTLKKAAFDVMVTGEKPFEYRKDSKWIRSRLFDSKTGKRKKYDFIHFTNGYGNDKPYFIVEYNGFTQFECDTNLYKPYSNGLIVGLMGPRDFKIFLGEIVEKKITNT